MNDDRRETIRRSEDVVSHASLAGEVKALRIEMSSHVHPEISRIIDLLEGEEETHLDGEKHRKKEEGMVERQKKIEADVAEIRQQGIKTRIAGSDWVKLLVALIGAVATILVGVH